MREFDQAIKQSINQNTWPAASASNVIPFMRKHMILVLYQDTKYFFDEPGRTRTDNICLRRAAAYPLAYGPNSQLVYLSSNFYLLTFSRFPFRYGRHNKKSSFDKTKNRTHDFRTRTCAILPSRPLGRRGFINRLL